MLARSAFRAINGAAQIGAFSRLYSTPAYSHFVVKRDEGSPVATVLFNRKPVNSLSLELLSEMSDVITHLEKDKTVKGLILASNVPKIFSAGLDITEMYQPKDERIRAFWRSLQEAWLKLYNTRLATIAAIEGHSPAGGCMMAMSCDYRVMAEGPFAIGLNETQLGIVAPFWFRDVMVNTVGHRQAEKLLGLGLMVPSKDALSIGLVDQVVPMEQVMPTAQAEMAKWLKIPEAARSITKKALRKATVDKLLAQREGDVEDFVKFATAPQVQASLGAYLQALQSKSKK
eukprot:Colp12_sorted_trinity150504_noHs@7428